VKHRNSSTRIPFKTIEEAVNGDAIAINRIVEHYHGYISKLSTKTLFDQYGGVYDYIDEDMRRQLQTKLITKILTFILE